MTALTKYQRLECPGLWRGAPDVQRREVAVAFGDASLVISDIRNGNALSHWSLPAVERIGSTSTPALYAPDREAHETLEIDDETMIAAIEKVRGVIAARRRSGGRLRRTISGGLAAAVALGVAIWIPGALVVHTATVLPAVKRAEIGAAVLAEITRQHGAACNEPLGRLALGRLRTRLLGQDRGQLVILRSGPGPAAHLPGGLVLLSRTLIEEADGPAVAAGHILAEAVAASRSDPVLPVLRHAGFVANLRLLTTGDLPATALRGYGAILLAKGAATPSATRLLDRMQTAGVAASPYAYARDPSGETTLQLIEADPFRATPPPMLLSDGDWVSLQGICGG